MAQLGILDVDGNATSLRMPPKGVRLGANANAFAGGYRLWKHHA